MPVRIDYASGASFLGLVTFADDYSQVLAVDGNLFGYSSASTAYTPGASTSIQWVANGGADLANGRFNYGTYLRDGAGTGYTNTIAFGYKFNNAPVLEFGQAGPFVSRVNGTDAFVSGSFVAAIPEPATWMLMILGIGGIGAALRHERRILRRREFTPSYV